MYDVVSLGELLIDFTPNGTNELGMKLFSQNPGGAPANVLAMFTKLGGKTAFIGKVGKDEFGQFLAQTISDAGIDTANLVYSTDVPTTIAFVHLDETGNRSFSFYRKPGADVTLEHGEVDESLLSNCDIFHFGSVSLTDESSREATKKSVRKAKAAGALISFEPNYRPLLWKDEQSAIKQIKDVLPLVDILKVSDDELPLLTGETDLDKGADQLLSYGASLVTVTLGAEGSFSKNAVASQQRPAYDVSAIDTTGAGDAFCGAMLYFISDKNKAQLRTMPAEELGEMLTFANVAGSLTVTKKGAIPAMPTKNEIMDAVAGIH